MGYAVERIRNPRSAAPQGHRGCQAERPGGKEPTDHEGKWISHSSQTGWLNEVVINTEQLVKLASI